MSNQYATVCAKCLCASCWLGEFYCEDARFANITVLSRREAEMLNREHIRWFDHPDARADVEGFAGRLYAPFKRLDSAGRDVTDLPGLWSEDDTLEAKR